MKVLLHPSRYLINLSHPEMEALNRVVEAGLFALEAKAADGVDSGLSLSARKAFTHWKGLNPLQTISSRPHRSPRTAVEPAGPSEPSQNGQGRPGAA